MFCFPAELAIRDGVWGVASIMKVASRSSILSSEAHDGSDHTVGPMELLSSLFQKKGFNFGPDCFGLLRMYIADPGNGGGSGILPLGGGGGGGGTPSPAVGGGGGGGGGASLSNIGRRGGGGGGSVVRESDDDTSCKDESGDLDETELGGSGGGGGGGGGNNVTSEDCTAVIPAGDSTLLPFDTVTFLRSIGGGSGGGLLALNSCSLDRPVEDCLSSWTSSISVTTSASLSDSLLRL